MGGVYSVDETQPLNGDATGNTTSVNYGGDAKIKRKRESQKSLLDRYFKISERGSTIRTEITAGAVNFIANSYLLVLMPHILAQGGVDGRRAVVAFVISTALGSCLVGLLANLPVPVGPGLGCAAFFAYGLTGDKETRNITVTQMGITCCLLAGLAMLVLALVDLPRRIFGIVPRCVKDAMPVGLGLLLSLCGFQQMGLVVSDPFTGVSLSKSISVSIILGSLGSIMMAFMEHKMYPVTKFVVPIAFFTLVAWFFHLSPWPTGFVSIPTFGPLLVNFQTLGKFFWSPVFGLFMICMFDIGGIVESVCGFADSIDKAKGIVSKKKQGLIGPHGIDGEYWIYACCGAATCVAAYLGATPVIAFGESFAGVQVGGRTGLTSVTSAVCFLCTMPFEPIFRAVPLYASAPVLVLLGVILLKLTKTLNLESIFTAFPSFCTIALMPFLYSIDKAIWAGLLTWSAMSVLDMIFGLMETKETKMQQSPNKIDLINRIDSILSKLKKAKAKLGDDYVSYKTTFSSEIDSMFHSAEISVAGAMDQLDHELHSDNDDQNQSLKRSKSNYAMLTPDLRIRSLSKHEEGKNTPKYYNDDDINLHQHP
eukprot:CAMPEP_0167803738 /NCGR_PEP_ID=MMETSP0111_2-20121227/20030_1 /TAXON_ID=91324 /ORGANISM="Lotharella globosa, Strain CCCM811" /LENGTH=593 /DNA_ID=CAMNT_0007700295 /DNA_START=1 /DNA_END=1782 /DNA_ORIENTATION=+